MFVTELCLFLCPILGRVERRKCDGTLSEDLPAGCRRWEVSAILSVGMATPPVLPFAGKGGETHRDPLMQSTAKYVL